MTVRTAGGISSCHRHMPNSSTHEIGSRYFRHVIITWSIRSRGSVHRTHIITKTRNQPLRMKTTTLTRLPTQKPRNESLGSTGDSPVCQPPRNRIVAMAETANIEPYSAMKNRLHRNPEYSVWN